MSRNTLLVIDGRVEDLFSVEEDSLLHYLKLNRCEVVQTALFMRDYFTGEVAESDVYEEMARCFQESPSYCHETQEIFFGQGEGVNLLHLLTKINDFVTEKLDGVEKTIPSEVFYKVSLVPQVALSDAVVLNLEIDD